MSLHEIKQNENHPYLVKSLFYKAREEGADLYKALMIY